MKEQENASQDDVVKSNVASVGDEKNEENKGKYELSLESMLKAGVHFGHKKSRWNPKMDGFIFGVRNGIHIINLEKTLSCFEKALVQVDEVVGKNGLILIVGTKKQAKELIKSVAEKADIPYVNDRWLGGTFTNFDIIKKRIKYLVDTRDGLEKGRFSALTKLERHKLIKKCDKIEDKMGGLVKMTKIPDLVIILDINKDEIALKEAKCAGVKVIGLVDSNSDPSKVNFPIPANDDALSSLKYILGVFLKRMLEAKNKQVSLTPEK